MPRTQIAKIKISYGPINRVIQAARTDGSPTLRGLRSASQVYVRFLKRRFMRFAQGGGNWEGLSPWYKKRKRKNKHLILFLNGQLFNDISFVRSRSRKRPGYRVGYVKGTSHRQFAGSVRRLAEIHQTEGVIRRSEGGRRVTRTIIVRPDPQTRREMLGHIQRGINADIRRSKRAGR